MKRIGLMIWWLLAAVFVSAEDGNSMLRLGKQWLEYYTNGMYQANYVYTIDGDTIIDGERYFTVSALMVDQWTGDTISSGRVANRLLGEKERRVFFLNDEKENLLFDFSLNAGDRLQLDERNVIEVTAVDTIYVMGREYRRQTVKKTNYASSGEIYSEKTAYWVEGIGGSHGLFDNIRNKLVTCTDGGRCLFTGLNFEDMPSLTQPVEEARQLVVEGREWIYHDDWDAPAFRLYAQGDTVIDGAAWKKIYREDMAGGIPCYEKSLREDEGRIYQRKPGAEQELLFDYTLKPGDRFAPSESDRYAEVVAIDTMMSAGQPYRRFILRQYLSGVGTALSYWAEGIGGDCGIDIPILWDDLTPPYKGRQTSDYPYIFVGCRDYGTPIFGSTTGISAPSVSKHSPQQGIYNLQGQRIMTTGRKGVYIQGGRKFIIR